MNNSDQPLFELQWNGILPISDYDTSADYFMRIKEKIKTSYSIQLVNQETSETEISSSIEMKIFSTFVLLNFSESTFEISCVLSKGDLPKYKNFNPSQFSKSITTLPKEKEDLLILTSSGISALYTTYKMLEEVVKELSTSKSISLLGMNILETTG